MLSCYVRSFTVHSRSHIILIRSENVSTNKLDRPIRLIVTVNVYGSGTSTSVIYNWTPKLHC